MLYTLGRLMCRDADSVISTKNVSRETRFTDYDREGDEGEKTQ